MSKNFKRGDLVKHSCAGNMDHMDAIFIKYNPEASPPKAIVEYTKGFRKGKKGEWLVEYLTPIEVTSKRRPELSGTSVHEITHDDIADAANYSVKRATSHITDPVCNKLLILTEKEKPMKAKITELYENGVLTQTLINDRDIKDLSSGQLMGYIGDANASIEKLTKHDGNKCKFIGQELKRMHQFIDSVYLILDEKFYTKTEIPEVK